MRALTVIGAIGIALSSGVLAAQAPYPVRLEFDTRIPMRDGLTLSTDIFRPDAPGKFPVILVRTPYDNSAAANTVRGRFWASRGYIYAVQDVRGRGDSDGKFYPLVTEADDGDDSITWLANQAWSNGKIGMTGGSYLGWVQVLAATKKNPHLAALNPIVTPSDPWRQFPMQYGAYSPSTISWLAYIDGHTLQDITQFDLLAVYRHLPMRDADRLMGRTFKAWHDWLDHPTPDAYWDQQSYQERLLQSPVPMLHISGWYDDVLPGTTENFINMTTRATDPAARRRQQLILGPWGHGINRSRYMGDIDFGPMAVIDLDTVQVRWFDRWLKGTENGAENDTPVRIFVMGENRWRNEREWPLARTRYLKFYLHSGGKANSLFGDGRLDTLPPMTEPTDSYRSDPAHPVTFITEADFHQMGGPDDYRPVERRDDMLVFTTAPLTESMEMCGPLTSSIVASSSARDTDWITRILDVHPDGFAQRLNEGVFRARYRHGMTKPAPLTPGEEARYDIDDWSTCIRLDAGHRLRVEVMSSAFPKWDVNQQTGGPIGSDSSGVIADQRVFHDRNRASYVVIPVVR